MYKYNSMSISLHSRPAGFKSTKIKGIDITELKKYSNMNVFKCPLLIIIIVIIHHSLSSYVYIPSITNLLYVCHPIFGFSIVPGLPNSLLSRIVIFKSKVIPLLPFVNTCPNHCILISKSYCIISTSRSCHLLTNN